MITLLKTGYAVVCDTYWHGRCGSPGPARPTKQEAIDAAVAAGWFQITSGCSFDYLCPGCDDGTLKG